MSLELIDFSQKSLWISFASITFNPLFWNTAARKGCERKRYKVAIDQQPKSSFLQNDLIKGLAALLFCSGNIFVLSSMYALGVTGTYLGDYFGILMDSRVTSFPFNVLENPMYYGSSMVFLSTALWYACPAGILLTTWAFTLYLIALQFEG
ncbi:26207_t:CDS:2 [Gigaspora rosea]|nr:26207_t:CDS:2 [Gigaspora rosea]